MVKKSSNKDFTKNILSSNLKYLTRLQYYGLLKDIEYISDAMILVFDSYTATEFYAGRTPVRIYVPSDSEEKIRQSIVVGARYFIIAAPYRITIQQKYKHRVDLLLSIFEEII